MPIESVLTDIVNKVAIASISSNLGFLAAVAISVVVEAGVILGAVIWHRSKAMAADTVKKHVLDSLNMDSVRVEDAAIAAARVSSKEYKARRSYLQKAAYRHFNANEK